MADWKFHLLCTWIRSAVVKALGFELRRLWVQTSVIKLGNSLATLFA